MRILLALLFFSLITVNAWGQHGATLTWSPATNNIGVVGYHVYRNGVLIGTTAATTYTDTTTAASTQYSYTVRAFDAAGNEAASSNVVTLTTLSTQSACNLTGGTSSSATNLGSALSNQSCTTFVLGNGYYTAATVSRAGITIQAANKCAANISPTLRINANNVTVDGVAIRGAANGIEVYNAGVVIRNSCISGFAKTNYSNGIWVYKSALNPNNHVIIENNDLTDWGGYLYPVAIAVGMAADSQDISDIAIEIRGNSAIGVYAGSTDVYSAGVQIFHPALIENNYISTVSGAGVQNKARNSIVRCNEFSNIKYDGAFNNRLFSGNVWEYNIVHDSDVGIDHYNGINVIYRGNVIYNTSTTGRIKKYEPTPPSNPTIVNNTFYNNSSGFIWDTSGAGQITGVLWQDNIFHTIGGRAINTVSGVPWDETGNIFWQTQRPTGTTGAGGTSLTLDPQFVNPPMDLTPQAAQAIGKGAPWPLACGH